MTKRNNRNLESSDNIKKAVEIAQTLNANPDDDWTYVVVRDDTNNSACIAIYDEDGEFVFITTVQ